MSIKWLVRLKAGYSATPDACGWQVTPDASPVHVGHMSAEAALFSSLGAARSYKRRQTPLVAKALEIVRVCVTEAGHVD